MYSVVSTKYLTSSDKTRIVGAEPLVKDGGGGKLYISFDDNVDDIPRQAIAKGESIDYIRRDALHYHQFNLEPWLEIAILLRNNGQQNLPWEGVITAAYEFYRDNIGVKRYEFAHTTDDFDRVRYKSSKSEYLQPKAMYKPDKVARVVFSYLHLQYLISGEQGRTAMTDDKLISYAMRSRDLSSSWFYYFRFIGV